MAITATERTQIIELTVLMFNAAPGATYLSQIVSLYESNGRSLSNLANIFAGTSAYVSLNPNFQTAEEFAAAFLTPLGLQGDSLAVDFVVSRFNSGATKGQIAYEGFVALNSIPAGAAQIYLDAKATLENKTEVAEYYSVEKQIAATDLATLQNVVDNVNATEASVTAAKAEVDGTAVQGVTYILTTGVDTVPGTTGNDVIVGNPGASNASTFTALDEIDGGAGTDRMEVSEIAGIGAANAYALSTSATVKNVEVVNYTVATDMATDTVAADVSAWTGVQTVNVIVAGTDADTKVTTKGNATAVSVSGASTGTIKDAATTDTLATVTLTDASGAVGIESDVLTTLNLTGMTATGSATVTAAAGTRALTVNLNAAASGAVVTDNTATTLTVNSTGAASTVAALNANAAKTVTLNADEKLTLTDLNLAAATTVTVKGDSLVTVGTGSDLTLVTSIDASAQTAGGISIVDALGTGVAFAGGAGADNITIGATTKAITTGAGNDRVVLAAGTTALGTGGSVDAGEGTTDTLAFLSADNANAVSATTTFEAAVAGFETIELAGAGTAAVALNLANLDDATNVKLSANVNQALTISNMASGGTLSVTFTQTNTTAVGVTGAATGTSDIVNVSLAGTAAVGTGALTIDNVEAVNFMTDDTATTATGIAHTSSLTAGALTTVTVAGDAGLTLTNTGSLKVATFEASGVTKGAVSWTTGALTVASTITGGAGADVLNAAAAVATVSLSGGAGNDTLTGSSTKANTISGGDGDDVIVGGSAADTIDGGAGADMITSGVGLDQVTGGAGNDTFVVVGGNVSNVYASILDAAAGDKLQFTDRGTETFTAANLTLAGTATFQDYLDATASGDGSTNGIIKWFQFGGNTYVVEDLSAGSSFVNGTDLVVQLTGLVSLTAATQAGHVITLA